MMLPFPQQLEQLQGMIGNQQPQQFGLTDKLGLLAASLGRSGSQGLGFGQSIGMAAGDLSDQTRQIEMYNRNLSRANLQDQLDLAKTGAQYQMQQQQMSNENARLALAQQQAQREQEAAAQREKLIGMLPPQAQTLLALGVSPKDALQSSGVLPQQPKVTAESERARKLAEESLLNFNTIEKLVYDKDGSVNRSALTFAGVGDGRTLDQALDRAIQNAVYLKTGAAATPSEMAALREQYKPSVRDTKKQVSLKLESFKSFLQNNAPNGIITPPQGGGKVIDFNELP